MQLSQAHEIINVPPVTDINQLNNKGTTAVCHFVSLSPPKNHDNIIVRFPDRPSHFSLTPYSTDDCHYSLALFPVLYFARMCQFPPSFLKNYAVIFHLLGELKRFSLTAFPSIHLYCYPSCY
jgi:hypothetical protein